LSFSASTRQVGDITIVDVSGRFTLIEGEAVHELLGDLFRDGRKRVLLNLRNVTYLDSSGIGQLVRSVFTARKNDADLRAVDLRIALRKSCASPTFTPSLRTSRTSRKRFAAFRVKKSSGARHGAARKAIDRGGLVVPDIKHRVELRHSQ
jgi:anti-sigma B factor antagonist